MPAWPAALTMPRKISLERLRIAVLAATLACSSALSPGTPSTNSGLRSAFGPGRLSLRRENFMHKVRSRQAQPNLSMLGGAISARLCSPECRESHAGRSQRGQNSQGLC